MKSRVSIVLFMMFVWLLTGCGGNPEADGDAAYAEGRYQQALSYYLEIIKTQPDNPRINEKIALSYMQKGLNLYQKRSSLDAFNGNFEKGQDFIPQGETSYWFNKEYSKMLYELAMAYYNSQPTNEIQKEQYFTNTLQNLEAALDYNPQNAEAEATLSQIRTNNFQKMYDKGMAFFTQARKEKSNTDLFLSAERFLERAVSFDPQNSEARKNLDAVRKHTLSILKISNNAPLAIAVGNQKTTSGNYLLAFTVFNNTSEEMTFDPGNVTLYSKKDQAFPVDLKQTAKLNKGLDKPESVSAKKELSGGLAFSVTAGFQPHYIEYTAGDGGSYKKYFP